MVSKLQIYYHTPIEKICIAQPVITMGTFDGIHLGHQAICKALQAKAKAIGGTPTLITFSQHPRFVLNPQLACQHYLIYTQQETLNIVQDYGITHIIFLAFTTALSQLQADEFLTKYLLRLHPCAVLIGHDHRLGKNRQAAYPIFKRFQKQYNFSLAQIPAQTLSKEIVSSTKIRNLINSGNIKQANQYLGRYYHFSGQVIRGKGLGKQLGFATANLMRDRTKIVLGDGVYAVKIIFQEKKYQGMMYVKRQAWKEYPLDVSIEVHIFNFNQDLYGNVLKIICLDKIREVQMFVKSEDLVAQLKKDQIIALKKMSCIL